MNIVCIHASLACALEAAGHRCLRLCPAAGVIRLEPLLGDFTPDLIFQQETLGPRTLIADLDEFSCLKVFWSIDTHLNSFWHQYYARLFDLFCTTQKYWLPWFAVRGVTQAAWLPWFGSARPISPWDGRAPGLVFVGRVTPERPVRQWFVHWLDQVGGLCVHQDLSRAQMLSLYDQSRIVPNEAIFGEVNFRLFEAASCGCAVLSPAVAHVEELFEPDREVGLFRDGAELADWVRRLRCNETQARLMGLRAWERVRKTHLPAHRAATFLAEVERTTQVARSTVKTRAAFWLALFALWESGRLPLSLDEMEQALLVLPLDADILAVLLRVAARKGTEAFTCLAVPVARQEHSAASLEVNLAGSLGALRHGDLTLARLFLARHLRQVGPERHEIEGSPLSICLAWARELQRLGHDARPGFVFNPKEHLPGSALECLVLASEYAPDNADVYRAMHRLLARTSGWEGLRLQALSYLSLRDRNNWRLGLELGVTDCRAFRVRQGLEELLLARDRAQVLGQGGRFSAALAALDHSGQIRRLLENGGQPENAQTTTHAHARNSAHP